MTTSFIEQNKTLPYIAHCYSNAWRYGQTAAQAQAAFKKLLGPLLVNPTLDMELNAGHKPVAIAVKAHDSAANAPVPGDIITLTQQDGDGTVVYAGQVDDTPETWDRNVKYEIVLQPIGIEMGLTPFYNVYTATDPATMWRDACALTKHVVADATTAPATGVTRAFDFSVTGTAKHVGEEVIKLVGNPNYYTFIDEVGRGWFGVGSAVGTPTYTVKRGADFQALKTKAPITKLYNYFAVIGGVIAGTKHSIAAVYDNGTITACTDITIPAPSYANGFSGASQYGVRARTPHFRFPKLLDQNSLNQIAATLGASLNRRQTQVEVTIRNFSQRITLARANGTTMRYSLPASAGGVLVTGFATGTYSPNYLITKVRTLGPVQVVTLTDLIPATTHQWYETQKALERMMAVSGSALQSGNGSIGPGDLVGATTGGPNSPTTPAFYNP